jgi:hypothetical protein
MYIIIKLKRDQYNNPFIDTNSEPTRTYKEYSSANKEAERLAEKHPGSYFGIFELDTVAVSPISPVKFIESGEF